VVERDSAMAIKTSSIQAANKLSETLNILMESYNLTVAELSQKTGLASTTIKRIKNDVMCNPTLDSLTVLAQFFSITVDELLGYKSRVMDQTQMTRVPLLNWDEVTLFLAQTSAQSIGHTAFIHTDSNVSARAFALKLNSVAMEPLFYEGTTVLFDPAPVPANRDCVLISFKAESQLLFRQWLVDGPNSYFRMINPEIMGEKTQLFDKKRHEVIAVMLEIGKKYR
jgi:transcriptional regulator with XRE-family HTH domain